MESNFIHYVGFVGNTSDRSVTLMIKRGTSKSDVLFLLTKMIQSIQDEDFQFQVQGAFKEVRVSQAPFAARREERIGV